MAVYAVIFSVGALYILRLIDRGPLAEVSRADGGCPSARLCAGRRARRTGGGP